MKQPSMLSKRFAETATVVAHAAGKPITFVLDCSPKLESVPFLLLVQYLSTAGASRVSGISANTSKRPNAPTDPRNKNTTASPNMSAT